MIDVNKIYQNIMYNISHGIALDEKDVNLLLENQELLTERQKIGLTENLSKINELIKANQHSEQKALMVTKKNPLLKLPIIKQIYGIIQKRKYNKFNKEQQGNMQQSDSYNNKEIQNKEKQKEGIREELKKENFKTQQPIKNETIVVSDLHGKIDRWEFVKQKLIKNPNIRCIILGDAMDRGDYGPEILLEIKELSDRGRVKYLPGNHDTFAYDYFNAKDKNEQIAKRALKHLNANKGKVTLEKLEKFDEIVDEELKSGRIQRKIKLKELMDWLGEQPIQTTLQENSINYAFSHAIFDTELYNFDKNFNLRKALDLQLENGSKDILNRFKNCIWYREEDKNLHFAPISFPKDFVMVVGHTPQEKINMKELGNNPEFPMVYVDSGKGNLQVFNLTQMKEIEIEHSQIENVNDKEQKAR